MPESTEVDTFVKIMKLTFFMGGLLPMGLYIAWYIAGKSLEEVLRTARTALSFAVFNLALQILYSKRAQSYPLLRSLHPWARKVGPNLLILAIALVSIEADLLQSPESFKVTFS